MLTRCYWETVFGGNIGDKKHAAYNEFFHAMNFQNNVVVVVMSSAFNPLQSDFKSGWHKDRFMYFCTKMNLKEAVGGWLKNTKNVKSRFQFNY